MEILKQVLTNQIFWGFIIGFALCVLALINLFNTKRELKRLKGHLSDKLEIEAEKMSEMKGVIDNLKSENENLRMKINAGRSQSDKQELDRNLEIYARAERMMMINAPGFAPAWEQAKEKAITEMESEESGKNVPKRIFKKLIKGGVGKDGSGEVIDALPDKSTTFTESNSDSVTGKAS